MALVMVFAMTPSMTVFAEDGDPEAVDPGTLEWQDVAVPMKPSDIPDYTHRQYYVNQQLLYNHYYAIKRAEIEPDPEKYGDYTEEDIDRESALYALDILGYIEKSTIGIRPDDPGHDRDDLIQIGDGRWERGEYNREPLIRQLR